MPPTIYRSGEAVSVSGLHKVIHYQAHPAESQPAEDMHRFVAGEIFPPCVICADDIAYLLITGAPHIFEDPDFASVR